MRRLGLFVYILWILESAVIDGEDFLFATNRGVTLYHSGDQGGSKNLISSGVVDNVNYHFSKNLLFTHMNNKLLKHTLDPNRSSEVDVVEAQLVKEFPWCGGFAVDWVHDRIYAAQCHPTRLDILSFGLNGEDQRTVMSWDEQNWLANMEMEIDPCKGILFWTVKQGIQSVETSGKGFNRNVAETSENTLALDLRKQRVYYMVLMDTDFFLYSMDYTGGDAIKHVSVPQFFGVYDLGILHDKLFWADYERGGDVLYEALLNLTGPEDVKTLTTLTVYVDDMKILHPSLQECPPNQTLRPDGEADLVVTTNVRFGVIVLSVVLVLGVVLVAVILVKVADKYWHRLGGETLRVPYSRSRGREGDGESTAGTTEYHEGEDRVDLV